MKLQSDAIPAIQPLSRRGFLSFCAATAFATRGLAEELAHKNGVRFTFQAPHPAHNPAFNYAETNDGELLIWRSGDAGKFAGFRLNRPAYRLWRCFDGKTPAAEAIEKSVQGPNYSNNTAQALVRSMEEKEILVRAGEVVLGHGMEIPPPGSVFVANVQKPQDGHA